jgi:hypothetical protein
MTATSSNVFCDNNDDETVKETGNNIGLGPGDETGDKTSDEAFFPPPSLG